MTATVSGTGASRVRQQWGQILARVLPDRLWVTIQSRRSRNHQLKHLASQGFLELGRQFVSRYGATVLHGPFRGMKYPIESALTRHVIPRLIGSYEMELSPVIEGLDRSYDSVIDIGAAEGYYAVGLAMRLRIPVYAFETDRRERARSKDMALLNGVGDLVIPRGFCRPEDFKVIGAKRVLILSDCEGYERTLFDRETIRSLGSANLIIETHGDETKELLTARFEPTHCVSVFHSTQRAAKDFPELGFLADQASLAISEERPPQSWLWCQSLQSAAP